MSAMSELDIEVRQAEADGRDYFPTQIYENPIVGEKRVWAIFDVQRARIAEHGIAFVRNPETANTLTFDTVGGANQWISDHR